MAELLERVNENGPAFEQDGVLYETYTSIADKVVELTEKTVHHCRKSGAYISKMALFPKGAYLMGSIMPERLNLDNDQLVHLPVQTYKGQEKQDKNKMLISRFMPERQEIEGHSLLVADEVWDKGQTIDFGKRFLAVRKAASIIVATIYFKPGQSQVPGRPDIYVAEYEGWIDFPWERERRLHPTVTDVSRRLDNPLIVDPDEYLEQLAA